MSPTSAPLRSATRSERSGRLIAAAVPTIAWIAAVWFASWAKGILIPLSFAVFVAVCLMPAVLWLRRWGLPCALGAALVMLLVSGLIGLVASRTRGDIEQLLDQMPTATRYLRREIDRSINDPGSLTHRLQMLAELPRAASTARTPPAPAPAPTASVAESTKQVASFTAELAAVLLLVYLLLAASDQLKQGHGNTAVEPATISSNMRATFAQFAHAMHRYLGVLVLTNTMLGLAVWIVFHQLGVQRPGAWGLAAALVHFVPYVGAAIFVGGAVLLTSIQFHSIAHGVLIGGIGLVLSTLIGVMFQTWLSGRSVRMNTIAVFVSLLVWGWLWGLPGLLLATPLTVALKVLCANSPDLQWIAMLLEQRQKKTQRRLGATVGASVLRAVQRVNHPR